MARHLPETMQPLHVWRQEQQHIPMDASSLAPLLQIFLRHLLGLILQFSTLIDRRQRQQYERYLHIIRDITAGRWQYIQPDTVAASPLVQAQLDLEIDLVPMDPLFLIRHQLPQRRTTVEPEH